MYIYELGNMWTYLYICICIMYISRGDLFWPREGDMISYGSPDSSMGTTRSRVWRHLLTC